MKLAHFLLEPGCILDQAVKDFGHGQDSIITDSIETPQLDASFDEADTMLSSVSVGFLCLISTICDIPELQLAPIIKFHKLWCLAKALLLSVLQEGKMSTFKLVFFQSSCSSWILGFFNI